MEALRHQLLQAELTRIEQEAEAKSYAIMNKADALVAAHVLCQKINTGIHEFDRFEASIGYTGPTNDCRIYINTLERGDLFLRRCDDLGLSWQDTGGALEVRFLRIDGVPGVEICVDEACIALRDTADEQAA